MPRIETFVFIDTETSGLPQYELNRTRVTELSLVGVRRAHVAPGGAPRVQQRLTLCLSPRRAVTPDAARLTGLCNELLEHAPPFAQPVHRALDSFLRLLPPPVCLVAHNGMGFDYPILRNHLQKLGLGLQEDLLCVDSFHGFYDILERRKLVATLSQGDISHQSSNNGSTLEHSITDDEPSRKKIKITDDEAILSTASPSEADNDLADSLSMKAWNETTPKKKKTVHYNNRKAKLLRRIPWLNSCKPKESYQLEDIYRRVLGKEPPLVAHRAENDCLLALEVACQLAEDFTTWAEDNCVPFSDIKPMTPGVKLGF